MRMTIPVETSIRRWMNDPVFQAAYDALEEEYTLTEALLQARPRARLSQAEVAAKMGTAQPAVARLESGRARPSLATLQRYGAATGHRLVIAFAPHRTKPPAPSRPRKRTAKSA
jgi:transcriptional regulator with XRE-family HTH domain